VWGPAPDSINKNKYYVSFIDDFSKFTWIYLLKKKSDVFQHFHDFQNHVERLFDKKIITMQTNWGGEYQKLNSFFQCVGITHHVSCRHAHQQNGSAERKHRHIMEVGLSLLAQASMPLKFWDEAFFTATYLINRIPSKVIDDDTQWNVYSMKNQISHFSALLDVLSGQTSVLTTKGNLNFDQNNVLLLVIATCTKAISALIFLPGEFIFPAMWSLMRPFFHSLAFIPMPVPDFVLKFFFSPNILLSISGMIF
jgi:hypothetical protein